MTDTLLTRIERQINESLTVRAVVTLLILTPFAFLLFTPIWDIDVWWHLASGRQIAIGHGLLHGDQFGFIPPDAPRMFLINSYWLAQILFYLSYKVGGLPGVIACKTLILLAVSAIIFAYSSYRRCNPFVSGLMAMLCGWLSISFSAERPQLFSMVFFTVLMLLLSEVGYAVRNTQFRHNYSIAFAIPVLMLIWANCHPGFILGSAIILIYAVAETINCLTSKGRVDKVAFWRVLAILMLSLAVTLVTPNHIANYVGLFAAEGSELQGRTSEYLSPLVLWSQYGIKTYPFFIFAAIFIAVATVSLKKISLTFFLIALFLFAIALRSFRYLPYFVFGSALELTVLISVMSAGFNRLRGGIALLAGCSILFCWHAVWADSRNLAAVVSNPVDRARFPQGATSFVALNNPPGRIFNHFSWGGYLIWYLYPHYQLFIDGRSLSGTAFTEFTRILWTPEWQTIFERRRIKTVIMPALDEFTGEFYLLADEIAQSDKWRLVYCDDTAFVAIDRSEESQSRALQDLPKSAIYRLAVRSGERMLRSGKNNADIRTSMILAYERLGDHINAEAVRNWVIAR